MSSSSDDRCRALTEDGERCSRPAQEDGFCHQHDESDRTVDDIEETDDVDETDASETADSDDGERPDNLESGIIEVREAVKAIGHDLIGHQIDRIIEVSKNGDGWQVTVEVVERSAVPDTQDILGKYEIELDSDETISGYHRVDRYRRADTDQANPPG